MTTPITDLAGLTIGLLLLGLVVTTMLMFSYRDSLRAMTRWRDLEAEQSKRYRDAYIELRHALAQREAELSAAEARWQEWLQTSELARSSDRASVSGSLLQAIVRSRLHREASQEVLGSAVLPPRERTLL